MEQQDITQEPGQEPTQEYITQIKQWISARLDELAPNDHFSIPGDVAKMAGINHKNLRSRVSRLNAQCAFNIKVHRDSTGALCIWHDPAPRPAPRTSKGELFDKLLGLQREQRSLLSAANSAKTIDEANDHSRKAAEMQAEIHTILDQMQVSEPEFKTGPKGKIWCPLEQVLKHIGCTKETWNLLEPREQLRRRIKAQIEIKEIRDRNDQAS